MAVLDGSIQLLYKTANELSVSAVVLLDGQWAFERDSGKVKVGDGVTAWDALAYTPWSQLTPAMLQTIADAIATEVTARGNADDALQTNIDNEATARSNADADLQTNIDNEATARGNADDALQTNIDNEVTARGNADDALQTNIDNEVTARSNADDTLQTNIDNEATARGNADDTLQNNIDNEVTARGNADANLQTQIDDIVSAGSGVSQSYVDDADTALQLEINDLQTRADNIEANQTADEVNISTLFGQISTEVTNRSNADTALLNKLNDIEGLALAGL